MNDVKSKRISIVKKAFRDQSSREPRVGDTLTEFQRSSGFRKPSSGRAVLQDSGVARSMTDAAMLATVAAHKNEDGTPFFDYEKADGSYLKNMVKVLSHLREERDNSLSSFTRANPELWSAINGFVKIDALRHRGYTTLIPSNHSGVRIRRGDPDNHDEHFLSGDDLINNEGDINEAVISGSSHGILTDSGNHNIMNTGTHHYAHDMAQFVLQGLHNDHEGGEIPTENDYYQNTLIPRIHKLIETYRKTRPFGARTYSVRPTTGANPLNKEVAQAVSLFGEHGYHGRPAPPQAGFLGPDAESHVEAQRYARDVHKHLMSQVMNFHQSPDSGGRHYLPGQNEFDEMNGAHMRHINALAVNLSALGLRGPQLRTAIQLGSHLWAKDWHEEKRESYKLGNNVAPSTPVRWTPDHQDWGGAHAAWMKAIPITKTTMHTVAEPWRG